jgi:hypothetical protein
VVAAGLWALLLAAGLGLPYLAGSPSSGDDLTRNPVRLALLYYAAAASLLLLIPPAEEATQSARVRLARGLWTLAWAAYLVHVGMAFHHFHDWSHAEAVEHTRRAGGLGEGIYFSHLFTLVWTADVLFWWGWPARHANRPAWITRALHGYMAFMIFNATVVFASGWMRWAGVALFAVLGTRWWQRRARLV